MMSDCRLEETRPKKKKKILKGLKGRGGFEVRVRLELALPSDYVSPVKTGVCNFAFAKLKKQLLLDPYLNPHQNVSASRGVNLLGSNKS